jgi:hydroxyethylthiazole kinase
MSLPPDCAPPAPTQPAILSPADLWADVQAVRQQAPLVHSVTNFVVMNFNANMLLAAGASPIMAHAVEEVPDMVAIAQAVAVNIGTLDSQWVPAMALALQTARRLGKPAVLDPVGAGASAYRNRTLAYLLAQGQPGIIRGNASEILSLAGVAGASHPASRGVDSAAASSDALHSARALSDQFNCVVCVSGEKDYVLGPAGACSVLANGHPWMTRVTGVGCSASALVAAFAAVQPNAWRACTSAMGFLGVAGQLAARRVAALGGGVGSYAVALLDAVDQLSEADFLATLNLQEGQA